MEALYKRHGALPLAISLIQDNTCRECNNQKILKFGVILIALNMLESISFLYPEKGHTHGPLDGTFGQMCVKLSLEEFQDDIDVVNILDSFLKTSGLDAATRQDAMAYKLDEAPEWVQWAEDVDLSMSALTGPAARTISGLVAGGIWAKRMGQATGQMTEATSLLGMMWSWSSRTAWPASMCPRSS